MAANLKMFRYLFAHETAVGLLTLAGVPHPNHYGAQRCNHPYLCSLLEITRLLILLIIWKGVCQLWQYLPFYTVFSLSLWPILYIEMKKSFTPLIPCQGVCHGDELALLYLPLALSSSGDRQMSRMMVDWWSNFAKHGWDQGQQNLLGWGRDQHNFLRQRVIQPDFQDQGCPPQFSFQESNSREWTVAGVGGEWAVLKNRWVLDFLIVNSSFQTTVHKWTFPMRWPPEWISGRAFVAWRVADMVVASTEDDLLLDSCKQLKFISNRRSVFFGILD